MKKAFLVITLIACTVLCALVFTACSGKYSSHEFTQGEIVWNDDRTEATVVITCENCGEQISEKADVKYEVSTAPTCTEDGRTVFSATVLIGGNTFNRFSEETITKAHGHDYGKAKYEFKKVSSGYECTATQECKICDDKISETVTCSVSTIKEATCTATGTDKYIATFTNSDYKEQTKYVTTEKKPHILTNVNYNWDNHVCHADGVCMVCKTSFSETATGVLTELKKSTCTVQGDGEYSAEFENPSFITQKETVKLPLSHLYSISYTWNSDKTACRATEVCALCHTVFKTEDATVTEKVTKEPTCTENGVKTHTAIFIDFENSTNTSSIAKLNHDFGEVVTVWNLEETIPECTNSRTCSRCNKITSETEKASSSITTPKTCWTDGERTYTVTFDTIFAQNKKTVTTTKIIPAGHEYGEPSYVWNGFTQCTATKNCSKCNDGETGHTVTETASDTQIISAITTEPSCTEDGEKTYTASFTSFDVDTATDTVAKLGHVYGSATYEWANDYSECTATVVCGRCHGNVYETVTVGAPEHLDKTCFADGHDIYTATFTKEEISADDRTVTKKITIEKGHEYGEVVYSWNADYTVCTATITCSLCNEGDENHSISENSLSAEIDIINAPTCTSKGTANIVITFSTAKYNTVIENLEISSKLAHVYNNVRYVWDYELMTCTAQKECAMCGAVDNSSRETVTATKQTVRDTDGTVRITYTATFVGAEYETQTSEIVLTLIN